MEKQTCYQRTGQTPAEVNKTTAVVSDDELFEKIDDFLVCLIYGEIDENDAFLAFLTLKLKELKNSLNQANLMPKLFLQCRTTM